MLSASAKIRPLSKVHRHYDLGRVEPQQQREHVRADDGHHRVQEVDGAAEEGQLRVPEEGEVPVDGEGGGVQRVGEQRGEDAAAEEANDALKEYFRNLRIHIQHRQVFPKRNEMTHQFYFLKNHELSYY